VDNYILKDVNGEKWATRVAKPSQLPEAMSLVLESMSGYRGSALTGNKGVYPDEYLKKYYGITSDVELLAKDGTGFKRGLRFQIEEGTYTVNVLFSTCDQATNDAQANVVYQANGVTGSPSGMPLNNATKFVELKNVVVGADGILDFYLGQKTAVFAGFSLIEIIKSK
jgi:hypothetical protein